MPATRPFLRNHGKPLLQRPSEQNDRHRRLYRELQAHNRNDEMVTYDSVTNGWVPYQRPVRVLSSGALTAVAASGFSNLPPEDFQPPTCPHDDPSKDPAYSQMALHLRKPYQGQKADFFRATTHNCYAMVRIPKLQPPLVLYSHEEVQEHLSFATDEEAADIRETQSYDQDFLQDFVETSPSRVSTSEMEEVELMLPPVAGSSRTPSVSRSSPAAGTPTRPLFSDAPTRNVPSAPGYNPRLLPSLTFGHRPSPSPRRITSGSQTETLKFFMESVADARKNSDTSLMTDIWYNEKMGVYRENPSLHPAWDAVHTARVLQPYDDRFYPGCTNRSNQHLDDFDSMLGKAIREANSTLGVPSTTIQAISELAVKCDCCGCMFSVDGYNRHLKDGQCTNSYLGLRVSPREGDIDTLRSLQLRTFAEASAPTSMEFLDTPIGVAFLEFNSRIGIPMDVFVTITTAFVKCTACHLCRTFPAHRAHLDDGGECTDLGEAGAVLATGKGKGKEDMSALGPEDGDGSGGVL